MEPGSIAGNPAILRPGGGRRRRASNAESQANTDIAVTDAVRITGTKTDLRNIVTLATGKENLN
jgi:hypothetical protein